MKDKEGIAWIALDLSVERERPTPAGVDKHDTESRRMWFHPRAFLVRSPDVDAFMKWAETVTFWGQWMPQAPESNQMFLGEYLWSPAYRHLNNGYYENEGWVTPDHDCPVSVYPAGYVYQQGSSSFDCSVESSFGFHLPNEELVRALDLTWTGNAAEFRDSTGEVIALDPSAFEEGPSCLLVRKDALTAALKKQGLSLCWIGLGEKMAYHFGKHQRIGAVEVSGAFTFRDDKLTGFLHFMDDKQVDKLADSILKTQRF
jgi:hypothetical protein